MHVKGNQVEVYRNDLLWGVGVWRENGGFVRYLRDGLNPWMMDSIDGELRKAMGCVYKPGNLSHPGDIVPNDLRALDPTYERPCAVGLW